MKENILVELSMDFFVDIINLVKFLKSNHEMIISNHALACIEIVGLITYNTPC